MSGGGGDLGQLEVRLVANTAALEAGFAKSVAATKALDATMKQSAGNMFGALEGVSGAALGFAMKVGKIEKSLAKAFGENAPKFMQDFGKSIESTAEKIGLTESQVKGLEQSVKSVAAAAKAASIAMGLVSVPLLVAGGAIAGIVVGAAMIAVGLEKVRALAIVAFAPIAVAMAPVAAIYVAVKLLGKAWDEVRAPLKAFWDSVVDVASGLPELFARAAKGMVSAMADGIAWILRDFAAMFSTLEKYDPTGAMQGLSGAASGAASGVQKAAAGFDPLKMITEGFGNAKGRITDAAAYVGGALKGAGDEFGKELGLVGGKLLEWMKAFAPEAGSKNDKLEKGQLANYAADYIELVRFYTLQAGEEEKRKAKMLSSFYESSDKLWNMVDKQEQETAKARSDMLEAETKMFVEGYEKEKKAISERWQAVASGQFGTAAGVGGTTGAAMNILGGKVANAGPNTSAVVSGAAAGGEAGGPWGALIGAIVSLIAQTKNFASILELVESLFTEILPILNQALRPVVASLKGAMNALSPVLKIVAKIGELLNGIMGPLEMITDLIGAATSAISGLIDGINMGGLNPISSDWVAGAKTDITAGVKDVFSSIGDAFAKGDVSDIKFEHNQNHILDVGGSILDQAKSWADQTGASVAAYMATLQLTDSTVQASKAMAVFSQSVLNGAQGYNLALTRNQTSGVLGGGGGGGGGGVSVQGTTLHVYLDSREISSHVVTGIQRGLDQGGAPSPFRGSVIG